ncbi:unnamed protein product [Urochloa humidicola]
MSSGQACDPPSFDLGVDDDETQLKDTTAPQHPKPNEGNVLAKTNIGAQPQVVPASLEHIKTPPTSHHPLDTTSPCLPSLAATPMISKPPKVYTAYQTPEHFIKNSSAPPSELTKIMSYGAVFARILEAESPSNKDAPAWDDEFTEEMHVKRTLVEGKIVKSHWFCGYEHPKRQNDILAPLCSSLYELEDHQLQSIWVDHKLPKPIKLSGKDFKDVICNGSAMSYEFCDNAIRRFIQLDSCAYP